MAIILVVLLRPLKKAMPGVWSISNGSATPMRGKSPTCREAPS